MQKYHTSTLAVLGAIIYHFREESKSTPENLAHAIGMSTSQFCLIEAGVGRISALDLWYLAGRLDTPIQNVYSTLEETLAWLARYEVELVNEYHRPSRDSKNLFGVELLQFCRERNLF